MKKVTLIVISAIIIFVVAFLVSIAVLKYQAKSNVSNFEQCAAQGNPIMESYPEQCRTPDGRLFIRDIGNAIDKWDLITVSSPRPGDIIKSPLTITGQARGNWFFEATFPMQLLDENGQLLGQGIAQAQDKWMTEEFVPFTATLEFKTPMTKKGTLILKKDNPSGLPENDDELMVPVKF